jgi:rRNA-processing protein FCF1
MRIKRGKKYKKYVSHFKVVYKFKPPYRVMIDGGFLHYAVTNGDFDLQSNLKKIIEEEPFLVMTKCIMRELESFS